MRQKSAFDAVEAAQNYINDHCGYQEHLEGERVKVALVVVFFVLIFGFGFVILFRLGGGLKVLTLTVWSMLFISLYFYYRRSVA